MKKKQKKKAVGKIDSFQVKSVALLQKVKDLIHEGNVRRISIQNEAGETIVEVLINIGLVGAIFAPGLVAIGALAAVLSDCTIVVERKAC